MLALARELGNSETAFVFPGGGEGYDLGLRFFTPTREVPVCGHATVAAHYVLAKLAGLSSSRLVQATGAGLLPVEVVTEGGDLKVVMTQGRVEYGAFLDGAQIASLLAALDLAEDELDGRLPARIVSTGHSKVLVAIRDKEALDALRPRNDLLTALSAVLGCNGFYIYTLDSREEGVLTAGRMFAPAIGIAEDPVTGNASGPLGAWLLRCGLLDSSDGLRRFVAKQGEAMGRKGLVEVLVDCSQGEAARVRIAGRARIVFRTEVDLPCRAPRAS
jgi:PhzF family phenazine biosynthesis protein